MKLIAIIPARRGSKGLPKKNTKALAGHPLIWHTIRAAKDSGVFSKVLVTSDDPLVLQIAEEENVIAIQRPADLCGDTVVMSQVVNHVLALDEALGVNAFVLLQPTAPLRTAAHIKGCAEVFEGGACKSAVSVCALDHPPQKALVVEGGHLSPLFSWDSLNQNRQTLPQAFRQNGAMWFVNCEAFRTEQRFVIAPAIPYVMDESASIDIDTADDFAIAQQLMTEEKAKNA